MLPEQVRHRGNVMNNFDGVLYDEHMIKDRETLDSIRNAVVGDDDILVATFPKAGTGWMLRILTLIKHHGDVEKADAVPLGLATRMLELEHMDAVLEEPEPRVIKTHMIYDHLPTNFRHGKNKIIYLARNPRDVCVSFYYFHRMMTDYDSNESFEEFFKDFMKGIVPCGFWSEHVKCYWNHRNDGNVMWLTYEDLQTNTKEKITEIAKFWGKELTDQQIETVAEESSFQTMNSKPTTDYAKYHFGGIINQTKSRYLRKGVVGDWRNHYTPEMLKEVDDMVEKEITPFGIKFNYE